MTTRLLVLANSFKHGRRCLAGLDEQQRLIRPVADADGEGIPTTRLIIGERAVAPGDVIDLELGTSVPLPFQRENVILQRQPLVYAAPLSQAQLQRRLSSAAEFIPAFATIARSRVDDSEYAAGLAPDSLGVLRTEQITMVWRHNIQGNLRPRAIFMTHQGGWDLPFTGEQWDDFPERSAGSRLTFGPSFVTVSVGDAWGGGSSHYVLAAGVIADRPY